MTRIERVSTLNDCGIFRNFRWPTDLPLFGRFNLIYGWNGTGKTTLSRLFRALGLRQPPLIGEVLLRIDGTEIPGKDFPLSTLPIRVFNRDFIHENVFHIGGGDLPPIFFVGKENIEIQKEIDRLKIMLTKKQQELDAAKQTQEEKDQNLTKFCSDRAKVIKDTLRKTGSAYNNYNRSDFKKRLEQMIIDGDTASHRLTDEQRESMLAQHLATPKPRVPEVSYRVPDLRILADEVSALLRTTVVSSAIQTLKSDSVLSDWIHRGLDLHRERRSDKCLFCEQPLPADHLGELEAHFNAEYERFLQRIDEKIQALEAVEEQATQVKIPNPAELYDDLRKAFIFTEEVFQRMFDAVRGYLAVLVEDLKRKRGEPFSTLSPSEAVPIFDAAAIDGLNKVVRRHNRACLEFDTHVRNARDRLAFDIIARSMEDFKKLSNTVKGATTAVNAIEAEVKDLTEEIKNLELEIRSHHRPAEEFNDDLKQYLGHGELQLTVEDNGYSITRNGVQAEMLSEGEMTAIALLYFLKTLEDSHFDKGNGVVILDDPVSSLDANALYLAFGFIRDRTRDTGQLFVLTHNFQFFRLVQQWFSQLNRQNKEVNKPPARFYMLEQVHRSTLRCTKFCALDPLLERYESEYHYLFARIYQSSTENKSNNLENY